MAILSSYIHENVEKVTRLFKSAMNPGKVNRSVRILVSQALILATMSVVSVAYAPQLLETSSAAQNAECVIGATEACPAQSPQEIYNLYGTTTDSTYWINVNGTSTQVYAKLNRTDDNGGWVLLMKGVRGSANFYYASTYFTSNSTTLNTTSMDTSAADAKMGVYNNLSVKKLLAVFNNPAGGTALTSNGDIQGNSFGGHVWLETLTSVQTAYTQLTTSRLLNNPTTGAITTATDYRLVPATKYYSTSPNTNLIFSYENQMGAYAFNNTYCTTGVFKSRWGIQWNENGPADFGSCDVFGGIGLEKGGTGLAQGDYYYYSGSGVATTAHGGMGFEIWGKVADPALAAPTNVYQTATSATSVTLNWTAPAGSPTSYVVQYKKTSDASYANTFVVTAQTTANITGLTANTPYDFRVFARTATDSSSAAGAITASCASAVPVTSGLLSNFTACGYNATTKVWTNSYTASGTSGNATATGTPTVVSVSADAFGNTQAFQAVQGVKTDSIDFGSAALPGTHTLFTVARYNPATPTDYSNGVTNSSVGRSRIFTSKVGNWLSGFWGGFSGVAFHGQTPAWQTPSTVDNHLNQWVLSSDVSAKTYRAATYRSYSSLGATTSTNNVNNTEAHGLIINGGAYPLEASNFQVAAVLSYNRVLTAPEVKLVEVYLSRLYGIRANVPATVTVNAGDSQTAGTGTAVATAPSVLVVDDRGAAVDSATVTFTVASGGGRLASSGVVYTNASGVATAPAWTLGATAGSNTLTASVANIADTTFTANGVVAFLSGLSTNIPATLTPTFNSATLSYSSDAASNLTAFKITARWTLSGETATWSTTGAETALSSGTASGDIAVSPGPNYIYVKTYRAGLLGSTYVLTVNRAIPTSINSFTPTSGESGTVVTITGANLTGASAVKFNGTPAMSFTVDSSTQIRAILPGGGNRTGLITATVGGSTLTSSGTFTANLGPAFEQSSNYYQSASSPTSGLFVYDPVTNRFTQMVGTGWTDVNGLAWSNADSYLYAFSQSGNTMYKIDKYGGQTAWGTNITNSISSPAGGDYWDGNETYTAGILQADNNNTWALVRIGTTATNSTAQTFTLTGSTYGALDATVTGSRTAGYYAWGLNNQTLYIVNLQTRAVTTKSVTGLPTGNNGYGAAYSDDAGNLYFYNNSTFRVYQITATEAVKASPAARLVGVGAAYVGPSPSTTTLNAPNDGAAYSAAASAFSPVVVANAAASITATGATISGTVTPNNDSISGISFCYGTSPTLAGCTAVALASSVYSGWATSSSNNAVNTTLTGLSKGTLYYYKLSATNSVGTTSSNPILSFYTSSAAPTVTTSAATDTTTTTVKLNGSVTPNEGTTTTRAYFCYGTASNLAGCTEVNAAISPLAQGAGATVDSATVTGLTSGTQYYFRAYATNSISTESGTILSFITATPPPVISVQPTDTSTTSTLTAVFRVTATAADSGALSYQWQTRTSSGGTWANVSTGTGGTTATYTTAALTTSNNGNQYQVIVYNTKTGVPGSVTSNTVTLSVLAAAGKPTVPNLTGNDGVSALASTLSKTVGSTQIFKSTATSPDGGVITQKWQRSTDNGVTWGDLGNTSNTYTTPTLTPLADFNGNQYRLFATNTLNNTSDTATSNVVTLSMGRLTLAAPDTPTVVTSAGNADRLLVSFGGVTNFSSYTLRTYLASNTGSVIAGASGTITNFTSGSAVTGLSPGTSYRFTITTVGDGINYETSTASFLSIAVTTNKAGLGKPSAPIVNPTSSTHKSLTVAWSSIPHATSYTLKLYAANGSTLLSTMTQVSGTSAVIDSDTYTSMAEATGYKVSVTAIGDTQYSDSLESSLSDLATTIAGDAAAPTISREPANVTKKANQTATFEVTASSTDGGTLSYQWKLSTDAGGNWANVSTGSGGTTRAYTTSSLPISSNNYQFRVVVTNTYAGSSEAVTSSTATLTVNKANQSSLTIDTRAGVVGKALRLAVSGGTTSGAVTYTVTNGSAVGCTFPSSSTSSSSPAYLSATSTGTCRATAIMAGNETYESVSSSSTEITFNVDEGSISMIVPRTIIYQQENLLSVTVGTAGKVDFFQNGKPVPGCQGIKATQTANAQCKWKPSLLGSATVMAVLTPTNRTLPSVNSLEYGATVVRR